MKKQSRFWDDIRGDAVVEATILFPIIMMIFAGLMLLAVYLPTRAVLQQATQYAATALATEQSDTWLDFNTPAMEYRWYTDKGQLPNVYAAFLASFMLQDTTDEAKRIVRQLEGRSLTSHSGTLRVECDIMNYVVYKEITVTATRTIPMPVDLSFVKFPTEIPITVSSSAVVLNGDEFVRNMDIAAEFMVYLEKKYNITVFSELSTWMDKVYSVMGIKGD